MPITAFAKLMIALWILINENWEEKLGRNFSFLLLKNALLFNQLYLKSIKDVITHPSLNFPLTGNQNVTIWFENVFMKFAEYL